VLGIATGYGLDGSGFETRWGKDVLFSISIQTGPGAQTGLIYNGCWVSFLGAKRPELVLDRPLQSRVEVKDGHSCLFILLCAF
jgi:hypothetical protein